MTPAPAIRRIDAPPPAELAPDVLGFLAGLGGPTLIRVPGRDRARARAVATLLHGNEPSGIRALHAWLRAGETPAVDLWCLVANVAAALAPPPFSHRTLPGRPDWNRCFLPPFAGPEGNVAAGALRLLAEARPESLLDLHNNTGHNPAYGVGLRADPATLQLTSLFGERLVVSDLRLGTLVEAMAPRCPSVTIECGRAGDPAADRAALTGLRRYAALERVPDRTPATPLRVFARPVRVRVRDGVRFDFGDGPRADLDLTVAADLDRHNFETLEAGTCLGWIGPAAPWPVVARDARDRDVSRDWFAVRDGRLVARRPGVPIMMTTDAAIATADCLFYLVQEDA